MSINAPIAYPDTLTNKNWQKNKGLLAKAAGETGIGALMDGVQKAYNAVNWSIFYAKAVCTKDNGVLLPKHVTEKLELVKNEHRTKVEALRKEAHKLNAQAEKIAADWKKSKTIPSSSTKVVQTVAAVSDDFYIALKDNGVYFTQVIKDFDEEKQRLQRLVDIATKGIKEKIATLEKEGKEVYQNPTIEGFKGDAKSGFYQRIRGIGADLANLSTDEKISEFREKTWIKFTRADFLPKSVEEVKPKVKLVADAMPKLKELVAHL